LSLPAESGAGILHTQKRTTSVRSNPQKKIALARRKRGGHFAYAKTHNFRQIKPAEKDCACPPKAGRAFCIRKNAQLPSDQNRRKTIELARRKRGRAFYRIKS